MKPKYPGQLLHKAKIDAEYRATHKKHHKKANDHDADDKHKKDMKHCKSCGMMHEKSHPHFKKHKKAMPKTFGGKSTKLGHGGRAKMLANKLGKKGLPKSEVGGIVGKIARMKHAAPGQKNFHAKKKR